MNLSSPPKPQDQQFLVPTETKLLARWTIGDTTPDGYDSLERSIRSFCSLYSADVVVCHNGGPFNLVDISPRFIDQRDWKPLGTIKPKGVAWKLYPPRLDPSRHEMQIDNDLILTGRVPEIDQFLEGDCTLLLEGDSRTYGRFERHVPAGFQINSGIFGMPPAFDMKPYMALTGNEWEKNAFGEHSENETFDEQGLVALALLSYRRHVIIPASSIGNCSKTLCGSLGHHFIGLNRRKHHRPYREFINRNFRFHL